MSKIAFLFPGQGAQKVGMAKELTESHPKAKELFIRAQGILGFDLLDICLNGPEARLNATDVSQPAIFVASLAALEVLKESHPGAVEGCTATAGLSLGEYTALVFAGALSFDEGLKLVRERGLAMQAAAEATPSGMASALIIDIPTLETVVAEAGAAGRIWLANYLCPGNTAISGETAALEMAMKLIETKGGKASPLAVAGAFHTEIMKPADQRLATVLGGMNLQNSRMPVWSNVDAQAHQTPAEFRELLVKQVLHPVLWEATMRKLLDEGYDQFYEIGPGAVLKGLMKRINRKTEVINITA